MIESLRSVGILLAVTGVIALSTGNRELPILGQGLFFAGILLVFAHIGARRAWKAFPAAPAALAALALARSAVMLYLHIKASRR